MKRITFVTVIATMLVSAMAHADYTQDMDACRQKSSPAEEAACVQAVIRANKQKFADSVAAIRAQAQRDEKVRSIVYRIDEDLNRLRTNFTADTLPDLDPSEPGNNPQEYWDRIRQALTELQALDAQKAQEKRNEASAVDDQLKPLFVAEDVCRRDKACMAKRWTKRACDWMLVSAPHVIDFNGHDAGYIAAIQSYRDAIAKERGNPGGVVDKVVLHDAGAAIQNLTQMMNGTKATYQQVTGKAWSPAVCKSVK